jgi:hypothetical protein
MITINSVQNAPLGKFIHNGQKFVLKNNEQPNRTTNMPEA